MEHWIPTCIWHISSPTRKCYLCTMLASFSISISIFSILTYLTFDMQCHNHATQCVCEFQRLTKRFYSALCERNSFHSRGLLQAFWDFSRHYPASSICHGTLPVYMTTRIQTNSWVLTSTYYLLFRYAGTLLRSFKYSCASISSKLTIRRESRQCGVKSTCFGMYKPHFLYLWRIHWHISVILQFVLQMGYALLWYPVTRWQ